MSDFDTSNDSTDSRDNQATFAGDDGKVTLVEANEAKHGYAGEDDIAKRQYGLETGEANENPVTEEPSRPSEKPTTQLGDQIENQNELLSGVQTEDDQEFETADETVEMQGSSGQQFQADRDIRWTSPEAVDRGEYDTKDDAEVAANMGLDELPVVDQSDKEPIPELVYRRAGEGLAQYEKRVGQEVLEAEESKRARDIAEPGTDPVEQGGETECPVEDVKYACGWFDGDEQEADEMSPTRQRAESAKVQAEAMAATPAVAPEPDAEQAGRLDRDLNGFDERAKLAAGMEPDVAWSPIERIGEEIIDLGPHVQRVAEAASITEKQALILLAEKRLETSSAGEAAMKAVGAAPQYFKSAPSPIEEVSPRGFVTTVEGKVTHLFDPMNENEHQVALIEDAVTGTSFKFIIHERTRQSKAWTEFHGDELITDLREGDTVKIIDGRPHYANGGVGANVKVHASSWTVIQLKERGDGEYVTFWRDGYSVPRAVLHCANQILCYWALTLSLLCVACGGSGGVRLEIGCRSPSAQSPVQS